MSSPRLIFPRGVRLARTDDVPAYAHPDVERAQHANIAPGFVIHPPEITTVSILFIEKASTVLFCHKGKWVELQGAN